MPPHVLGQVARVKEEALRSRVVAPQVGGSGHPRDRQHAVYVDEQAVDLTHVDLRSIVVTPDPRRWRGLTSQVIGTDRGSARQ